MLHPIINQIGVERAVVKKKDCDMTISCGQILPGEKKYFEAASL
jgi:hypothetical protein